MSESPRRSTRCAAQAGFTLIELMVVVAIVGILVTTAGLMISRDPRAMDVGNQIAGVISEGSRKAVSGGAVDAEYVKVNKVSEGVAVFARTKITIENFGAYQWISIDRRIDTDPGTSNNWQRLMTRQVSANIEVVGFERAARLSPGFGPTDLISGTAMELFCYPDGKCAPMGSTQGATIYVRDKQRPEDDARIVVMPLRGVPAVYSEW